MANETDDWEDTVAVLPGDLDRDAAPTQAYLVVVRGNNVGTSFPVTGPKMTIGRGASADLRLNDDGVSRFHCRLHYQPTGIAVEDLGSRNGTYCNGERVLPGLRLLAEGDRLQVGTSFVLRFTYVESADATAPVAKVELNDPMTGAYGRRQFTDRLETEVDSAIAKKVPLSLMLVHIDRFADIVADYGREAVDKIAVEVAGHLRESPRRDDVLGRLGHGDFALLSLWVSPGDTFMLAEGLRKRVNERGIGAPMPMSLSLGIAAMHELNVESAHDLLLAAGSALHRARSLGGNRSVLCTPDLMREPRSRATV